MFDFLKRVVDVLVFIVFIGVEGVLMFLAGYLLYGLFHIAIGINIFWTRVLSLITFVVMWRFWDGLLGD